MISELPLPSPGKGYRGQPLLEYLPQLGFEVTAICPLDSRRRNCAEENKNIHYVKPGFDKSFRYDLKYRTALMISIFIEAKKIIRKEQIDLIRGIHLFPSFLGLLSSFKEIPVIAELPDFYSELYGAFNMPFANIGANVLSVIENWTAQNLTVSYVESPAMRELWIKRGASGRKCVVLPDGVYLTRFNPNIPKNQIRKKLGISVSDRIVFYHGDISEVDGVDILLRAASIVLKNTKKRVIFLIVGSGSPSYIKKLALLTEDMGLQKDVIFTGWIQDWNEIPYYIAEADVCVAPFRTALGTNTSVMQKVKEYIAMGKPIIASEARGLSQMTGNLLHMVKPGDHVELAKAITRVLFENVEWDSIRSKNVAKRMDWKCIVEQEAAIMKHVLKRDVENYSVYDYLFKP